MGRIQPIIGYKSLLLVSKFKGSSKEWYKIASSAPETLLKLGHAQ